MSGWVSRGALDGVLRFNVSNRMDTKMISRDFLVLTAVESIYRESNTFHVGQYIYTYKAATIGTRKLSYRLGLIDFKGIIEIESIVL